WFQTCSVMRAARAPVDVVGRPALGRNECALASIVCSAAATGIIVMELNGKKIAILATNGFEQSELGTPRDRLKKAGATVDVVSLAAGEIKGWDKKDWGRSVKVDKTLDEVSAKDCGA